MKVLTISIPLPPTDCKQNTHKHWRAKSKAIKHAREEACFIGTAVRMANGAFTGPVTISHTWYMAADPTEGAKGHPKRYRPLDEGNAIGALKGSIDGLVDSGLIVGDSHKLLRWGDGVLKRCAKEHLGRHCVELRIEEICQ